MCTPFYFLFYMDDILYGGQQVSSSIDSLNNMIMQKKENQKARDFNSKEAQKSRDYNTWLLENQTQLKSRDARSAGLNPAFMNGSVLGATPTPSSSPSSPSGIYPMHTDLLNNELLRAQIGNVDAMTDKVNTEVEHNNIENSYLPALMQNQIALAGSNIDLNIANAHLSRSQANQVAQAIAESEQRIAKMTGEMNIMRKQFDILSHEEKIKAIEEAYKSDEMQALISSYRAQANLSVVQANDIVKSFCYRMYGLVSQSELNDANAIKVRWDGASSKLKFDLDSSYAEPERVLGIINGSVSALQGAGDIVLKFLPAGKAAKLAGGVKQIKSVQ